jgi:hypothetical protein
MRRLAALVALLIVGLATSRTTSDNHSSSSVIARPLVSPAAVATPQQSGFSPRIFVLNLGPAPVSRSLVRLSLEPTLEPSPTPDPTPVVVPTPAPTTTPVAVQAVTTHVVVAVTSKPVSSQLLGSTVWDELAGCESGHHWGDDTGNGFYGGLQFDYGTWIGAGGGKYAPRADKATREQQIAIAWAVQHARGWGPWPACSRKLGLYGIVPPPLA